MEIPEIDIKLIPLSKEANDILGFKWASSEAGQRSKIGGTPTLRPHDHWPNCNACDEKMTFLTQIDSLGDNFTFADLGMVLVFICMDCFEVEGFVTTG
jgi:uncharacterized protein YwqG